MRLLGGFSRCHGHAFIASRKHIFVACFCVLLGQQVAGSTFSDRLDKMLKSPSKHGKKVAKWNPDPKMRLRVKRALKDVNPEFENEYEEGYGLSQGDELYGNDSCSEDLKYEFTEIFEQSYKGPVCDIIDARNNARHMKDLENCVIVNGFVHLVFMHELTEADLLKYRFPKLRVITHYLLVFRMFNLKTLRYMFPNLAIIGGKELFKDYALVLYENPQMKEIGLESLQFITHGAVRIQKNPMLCYLTTINWERLGSYPENSWLAEKLVLSDNRDVGQCVDQCGDNSNCEKDGGRELCWGLNQCQKKLCPEECRHACLEGQCKCHEECLAGCTNPDDPTACFACRNKYHNGTCLGECPVGTYLIHDWLCIQKEECQKLDWSFFGNKCQYSCPRGYQVNVTDCMNVCEECTTDCGQECKRNFVVSDVRSLRELEGCRQIDGTLTISISGGSEVVERLDDAMKEIEVIGSLVVRRSFPLVTLNFLRNLKRITGKNMEQDVYSVYILENKNLKQLWNFSAKGMVIDEGKAFFHFNPQLCLSEVRKIEHLTPDGEDDTDISDTTNGDKATCHFTPIKILDVQINDEPFVKIYWENFVVKDERTLIGYQVFYKESAEQNAKKNEGVDACRLNSWTIVDKPKSEDAHYSIENGTMRTIYPNFTQPGETSKLLSNLKAYTQYAYYVQAYTTSTAESGAASKIQYFMTKPAQPGQPRNLRATGSTTSTIDVTWDPPALPNGRITHYIVEWQRQEEEDLTTVRSIDTCRPGYNKAPANRKPSTPKPSVDETPKEDGEKTARDGGKCNCQCEKDEISKEDELEAQESSEFENFLQDEVFFVSNENMDFVDYENIDSGQYDDAYMYDGYNETNMRKKRSVANVSINSANDSAPTNFTMRDVGSLPTNATVENETTPESKDPSFAKVRIVVVNGSKATLTGLHYYSEYNVQVYACNHASDPRSKNDLRFKIKEEIDRNGVPRAKSKYTKCSFEAMVMKRTAQNESADVVPPGSVKVIGKEDGMPEGVTRLYWEMPVDPNAYIRFFTIEVTPADGQNPKPLEKGICVHVNATVTDAMSHDILSAKTIPAGSYKARIRPTSLFGDGDWSDPISFELADVNESDTLVLTVLLTVFALILVAMVIGVVCFFKMRKNVPNQYPTYEDYNPEYARYVYIPDEYEVEIEKVTILDEIGHGNFGKVFSGIVKSIVKGEEETKVAIKKLHDNAMPSRRYEFLKEASMMKAFNAHHVVRLLGVVSQGPDPMVIMEYMAQGDLKSYLRSRRENAEENSQHILPPTLQEKLQMAAEIADGMAYLAAYKFVHRDLAARNCLVNGSGTVKIGDFGLTRDIYETDYYRKENRGFLPIRWMAPESLKDGVFDSRSDVWSYGVVLWELATLAEQPYQAQPHSEVTRLVIDGGCMKKPPDCPKRLYDLMTLCWQYNPKMRPIFLEIVQELYVDVSDDFKEVCFYGKHDRVGSVEDDEGQFLVPHENNSDGTDVLYPQKDVHFGASITDNNSPQPSWPAGDQNFKNLSKSDRISSLPIWTKNNEKQSLLPERGESESPSPGDGRAPDTKPTTARASPTGADNRTKRRHYSSESSYENDYEAVLRKNPSTRDSGTYISPQMMEKDPLVDFRHLNGGHKKDFELDLESGVDEGTWGNSSTTSPSNRSTPTEIHSMLSPAGLSDNPIDTLLDNC